ncbi:hypothetical protein PCH_Pc16g12930 [Penicillium rubens Wisconsin 54-1255]|uniref:Uncharacterized protein n=1 Tax=Penicillium rubens (strain ATCC 28089 / DSM 1075 / NRRL 1951 / Wisconsin 54-1255) TaxID=500485 RepID=B6HAI4_PENRW|nr:hypothetical protein PCH_Pc16g12930 [Penicillium rubens Wisconsin 54-1255]
MNLDVGSGRLRGIEVEDGGSGMDYRINGGARVRSVQSPRMAIYGLIGKCSRRLNDRETYRENSFSDTKDAGVSKLTSVPFRWGAFNFPENSRSKPVDIHMCVVLQTGVLSSDSGFVEGQRTDHI